jgi:hypothetical protein
LSFGLQQKVANLSHLAYQTNGIFCLTFALFVVKFCHAKDFASEN